MCVDTRVGERLTEGDGISDGGGEGAHSPQNSWQAVKNDIAGGDFK